jgi:CRISPR/Cas system CSM-associated protein Csm4 (group 5 of RAMP superfamily)
MEIFLFKPSSLPKPNEKKDEIFPNEAKKTRKCMINHFHSLRNNKIKTENKNNTNIGQ